ncbi:prisilkin-39 [Drosophila hydei]|uniref:Prisilkin-39 n=1 Tax=Drosophila hydei TaxID=7224 RepID=A0A6J1MH08_DROHY|nr:prisilkin-39 [Drosophila hydei]
MKLLFYSCLLLLLAAAAVQASVIPASTGVAIPAPALLPVAGSHQFVARNYNGYYVPTTTATAWPAWTSYPSTYYKYSGGYPTYTYPSYSYPYGYYPSYASYPSYGYGYKSVW